MNNIARVFPIQEECLLIINLLHFPLIYKIIKAITALIYLR